jgi:hypothetical protein
VLVQAAVLPVPSRRARCLNDPEGVVAPLPMGRCISCLLVKSRRVVHLFLLSLLGQFVRVNFPLLSASHPSGLRAFEYCTALLAVLPTGPIHPDWHRRGLKMVLEQWLFDKQREKRRNYYRDSYLNSDDWKRKRAVVLKRDRHRCVYCGARATQVHHKQYARRNIGREPIEWLVSLCKPCHEGQHE